MKVSCEEPFTESSSSVGGKYFISQQHLFIQNDTAVNFIVKNIENKKNLNVKLRFKQVDLEHTPVVPCNTCKGKFSSSTSKKYVFELEESPNYSTKYILSNDSCSAVVTFLTESNHAHVLPIIFRCSASHHGQGKKFELIFSAGESDEDNVSKYCVNVTTTPKRAYQCFLEQQKYPVEAGTKREEKQEYVVVVDAKYGERLSAWVRKNGGKCKKVD